MKKIWLFLLTVSMLFCLAACAGDGDTTGAGDGTAPQESASMDQDVTKEDLLAGATEVTVANIMNDINNNMAKANMMYMDKTFLISGDTITSGEIKSDCVLCDHGVIRFQYMLPEEELATLNAGDALEVVGVISGMDISQETWVGGAVTDITTVVIRPAFLK